MQVYSALFFARLTASSSEGHANGLAHRAVAGHGIGQGVFIHRLDKAYLRFPEYRFQAAVGGDDAAVICSVEAFGNVEVRFSVAYHVAQDNL